MQCKVQNTVQILQKSNTKLSHKSHMQQNTKYKYNASLQNTEIKNTEYNGAL